MNRVGARAPRILLYRVVRFPCAYHITVGRRGFFGDQTFGSIRKVRDILKVLFICIKNASRSPMAEALLKMSAKRGIQVCSAGIKPGKEVNEQAVKAMREIGCDLSGHEPKHIDRKSTRLNSSHSQISYAVFCLKKKKKTIIDIELCVKNFKYIHSSFTSTDMSVTVA